MRLTVAYITFRQNPRFEWFAASFARELRSMPDVDAGQVQVVVVDGALWQGGAGRERQMREWAAGRVAFEHHAPKPSAWQGPHRQTNRDYFCAAAARNTALAYARGEHVIFVDDLTVLLPGWLKAHVHAAQHGYVLCGTTCKENQIEVDLETGDVVKFTPHPAGRDSRLAHLDPALDLQPCRGGWLFGGTFSVPTWLAMAVNGQDEIYDTIGGEDYDFGIRLERAGASVQIARSCAVLEAEDGAAGQVMVRIDRPWPGPDGPYASNYLLHKLMALEPKRSWTVGNDFALRSVRKTVLEGGEFPPVPERDLTYWVDGRRLREM